MKKKIKVILPKLRKGQKCWLCKKEIKKDWCWNGHFFDGKCKAKDTAKKIRSYLFATRSMNKEIKENWEKCKCLCHDDKHSTKSAIEQGLIHDSLCCERMNGSLMLSGVRQLFAQERQKAYEECKKAKNITAAQNYLAGKEYIKKVAGI